MNEIMNGIEILNQTEIVQTPLWAKLLLCIGMIIMVLSVVISLFAANSYKEVLAMVFLIVALISCIGAIIGLFSTVFITEPTGKYKYDCLISEDVSMTEFYEKYEVIETNGKIWTIKEK